MPTGYKFFSFYLNIYFYVTGKRNLKKKIYRCNVLIYCVSSQQSPARLAFFYTWPWERFPLLSYCTCTSGYKFFSFYLNIYFYVTGKRNLKKKIYRCNVLIYCVSSQQSPARLAFFYTWPWERFPLLSYCTSGCLHPGPALVNEDHVRLILLYRGSQANRIL